MVDRQEGTVRRPAPSARRRLLFVLYVVLASAVLLEVGARLLTVEKNGGPHLFGVRLLPLPLVPEDHRRILERASEGTSYVRPDPGVGWEIRPLARSQDGLYRSDEDGMRIDPRDPSPVATGDRTLVLLCGDSFTHGDEVAFEDTLGARLEERLGGSHHVRNAGVPGYGIDQAVLRFEKLAPGLLPKVAVLSICRDDLFRNLNVFRSLYHHWTDFPWSKPRFLLEGQGLRLVNVPTIPVDAITAALESVQGSEIGGWDRCYWPGLFTDTAWNRSRLLQFILSRREHQGRHQHLESLVHEGGEGIEVAVRIVARFFASARNAGARPLLVILPEFRDLPAYKDKRAPRLAPLLSALRKQGLPHLDPSPHLVADLADGEATGVYFVDGVGHPNRRMNDRVADLLGAEILGR